MTSGAWARSLSAIVGNGFSPPCERLEAMPVRRSAVAVSEGWRLNDKTS